MDQLQLGGNFETTESFGKKIILRCREDSIQVKTTSMLNYLNIKKISYAACIFLD